MSLRLDTFVALLPASIAGWLERHAAARIEYLEAENRALRIYLGAARSGQNVGIKEVSEKIRLVSFMQYDLGFFDHETGRVTSAESPFGAKVTHVPGIERYLCNRNGS